MQNLALTSQFSNSGRRGSSSSNSFNSLVLNGVLPPSEDGRVEAIQAVKPDQAGGTPTGPSSGSGGKGDDVSDKDSIERERRDVPPGPGGWGHGRFSPAGNDTVGGGVVFVPPSGSGTSSSFGSQSNSDSNNSKSKNKAFRDELIRYLRQNYDMQGFQTKVIDVFVNAIQSLIDFYRMDPNNVVSKEIKRILESIFTNIQYSEELQKKLLEFIDSNPSGVDKKTVFSNSRPIRLDPPLVSQNSVDKDGNPYTLDILEYEVYWAYIDGQYELILKVSLGSRIYGTQPQVFTIRLKTGV